MHCALLSVYILVALAFNQYGPQHFAHSRERLRNYYTVKKVSDFPILSRDINSWPGRVWQVASR